MSEFQGHTRRFKKVTIRPSATTDTALEIIDRTGSVQYSLTGAGTASSTAAQTIDVASTTALAVGANGTTNPVLLVDSGTASVATGVEVTGAAAGAGVSVAAISSGTDEDLFLDGKAAGEVEIGNTSTGLIKLHRGTNYKRQVTDTGGAFAVPIVLTTAQSGRAILLDDAAGLDFTLPAIAAADIGTFFDFFCTVTLTSNSYRMTAAAGDLLFGAVWIADFDTANTGTYFAADGSDDLVFTMDGSTKGGKKGTWVRFTATSATQWFVQGIVFGDGSLATPFS